MPRQEPRVNDSDATTVEEEDLRTQSEKERDHKKIKKFHWQRLRGLYERSKGMEGFHKIKAAKRRRRREKRQAEAKKKKEEAKEEEKPMTRRRRRDDYLAEMEQEDAEEGPSERAKTQ